MMRVLGTFGRMPGGLASWVFGVADGGMTIGVVIKRKTLSLTFFAMDTTVLQAAIGMLCTKSSSYSITYLVPSPVSLSVRLVITKVS